MAGLTRDLNRLANTHYDVLVVGAGIYGACIARDAALRGLRVALIERRDFGGSTSHNSLKLIHGGFRYLQQADIPRIRESIRERRAWLSIAPHLIRPLKFVVPTYGHGMRGPEIFNIALQMYEAVRGKTDRAVTGDQAIPKGEVLSKQACLDLIPNIPTENLTGGATWYDGQMLNADRVLLECLIDAVEAGADAANYVSAEKFLSSADHVTGITARDEQSGDTFDISASVTINATGPWVRSLLNRHASVASGIRLSALTKGVNIVTRKLFDGYAVGLAGARTSKSLVGGSGRLYFFTPWFDRTIIGTTHAPYDGDPKAFKVEDDDIDLLLSDLATALPDAALSRDDIDYCYGGLTPAESVSGTGRVSRARRAGIFDHEVVDGIGGFVSVAGVKYTTSRLVAESVTDLIFRKLNKPAPPCITAERLLPGARGFESREAVEKDAAITLQTAGPPKDEITNLVTTYGTQFKMLLPAQTRIERDDDLLFRARIRYSIEHEMALKLCDLLLLRYDAAPRGGLTPARIQWAAQALAEAQSWTSEQIRSELDGLTDRLILQGGKPPPPEIRDNLFASKGQTNKSPGPARIGEP